MVSVSGDKVISPFQLSSHRVCSLAINTTEFATGGEATLDFKFDYDFSLGELDTDWVGKILFIVDTVCKKLEKQEDESDEIFSLLLKMEGEFTEDKGRADEEHFTKSLSINGLTVMMQLARAYLATATSFWGIGPSVILPMVNIHDLIRNKAENISTEENKP